MLSGHHDRRPVIPRPVTVVQVVLDFHHKASSSHPLHAYAIAFKFVPVGPYTIMRRLLLPDQH
jgi:hypothetical protein